MPQDSLLSIGKNMAEFLWSLKSEFPQIEVYTGVPPGFKFDPSWSQEESFERAAKVMTFTIRTETALSPEKQAEIRKRVAEKFIHFISGKIVFHSQ